MHPDDVKAWGLMDGGYAMMASARGSVDAPLVVTTHGLEEFQSHIRLKHWLYAPFRAGMRTVAARSDVVAGIPVRETLSPINSAS